MPDKLTDAELAEGLAKGEAAEWRSGSPRLGNQEAWETVCSWKDWVDDHGETALRELAALREQVAGYPSPGVLKLYKQAAHEQGKLFCWCVANLEKFPPIEGDWLDEVKRRLKPTDQLAALDAPAVSSEPTEEQSE